MEIQTFLNAMSILFKANEFSKCDRHTFANDLSLYFKDAVYFEQSTSQKCVSIANRSRLCSKTEGCREGFWCKL